MVKADFELVLEKVFLIGNLTVEAEELLFLLVEGLAGVLASVSSSDHVSPTLMSTLFFW